jgi:hypothetical protein
MPMGLWDIDCSNGMCRVVHEPTLDAFLQTQEKIEAHPASGQSGD